MNTLYSLKKNSILSISPVTYIRLLLSGSVVTCFTPLILLVVAPDSYLFAPPQELEQK